jgi:hypothetical protein
VELDLATDERTEETSLLSLAGVDLHDLLLKSTADKVIPREPNVLRGGEADEGALVLEGLLEPVERAGGQRLVHHRGTPKENSLLAVDDILDDALSALDNDGRSILHPLLLLLGELAVALGELLEILTSLVTLEHVLEGGEVKVVVDVVEGVLSDVSDDKVGVLPDLTTLVGLGLSDKELDEGRLSRSVGSEDSDTGGEGNLERDVVELLDGRGGVLESNVTHLHERLFLGLDSVEKGRVGELELVLLVDVELVVGLGLGDVLDEGLEVTRVPLNLEAVKVEDVGGDVVEEARVVCWEKEGERRSARCSAKASRLLQRRTHGKR